MAFLRSLQRFPRGPIALAALALAVGGIGYAQTVADRDDAPVDSSGSFEVGGISVDTSGKTAEEARMAGWRLAQRKGWAMLAARLGGRAGGLSDGALDSIVSGIVVENEEIGPNRYVARLGVLFDRGRAAAILGVAGLSNRSPPMLVIPLLYSGGVGTVFETRTPWQQAWARYRTGNSAIDYIRPSGTGPDAMLYNAGQLGRPSRGWWRGALDQYGASDVVIPEARLYRQWPGGPVIGVFTARYGPDNRVIKRFVLRVANSGSLDALLDAGVKRMDDAYQEALRTGVLRPDIGLIGPPEQVVEEEATTEAEGEVATGTDDLATVGSNVGTSVMIQFDSPDSAALTSAEASVRGLPSVRAAATTSMALGGVSVMRVMYDGDIAGLRAALQARGWQVDEGGGTLRIRRGSRPDPLPSPSPPEG